MFFKVLEKFTENVRFCIICNYLSKIIPAIQSRCTRFRFGPLSEDKMTTRLEHIIEQEKYLLDKFYNHGRFTLEWHQHFSDPQIKQFPLKLG